MNNWLTGNCLDLLPTLEPQSVQMICTSPPYYQQRDYETGHWEGGDAACDHRMPRSTNRVKPGTKSATNLGSGPITWNVCGKCGAERIDEQLGMENSPEEYIANLVEVFRQVRRVLRDDGTVWLNLGDSYASSWPCRRRSQIGSGSLENGARENRPPRMGEYLKDKDLIMIPARVALALQQDGWCLRSDIIYAKRNPMPESVLDRPTSSHEHVFLLSKKPRYFYDREAIRCPQTGRGGGMTFSNVKERRDCGRVFKRDGIKGANARSVWPIEEDVWLISVQSLKHAHYAVMPLELAERCIRAGTSEKGCCPRCGAPWHQIQRRTSFDGRSVIVSAQDRYSRDENGDHLSENHQIGSGRASFGGAILLQTEEIGWQPSCDCDAGDPVPCVVLDPFAGAGTTAYAATKLGRDSINIELNPKYGEIAAKRMLIVV